MAGLDIGATIAVLNRMVAEHIAEDYAIGGAFALLFYIEPQETSDLDVFVIVPGSGGPIITLTGLFSWLQGLGHTHAGEHVMIHGILVQFLVPEDALAEDGLRHARQRTVGDQPVKVLPAEHLAARMVKLRRAKDLARLPLLLEAEGFDRSRFEALVARFGLTADWQRVKERLDV